MSDAWQARAKSLALHLVKAEAEIERLDNDLDRATDLLERWQYDDTISGGPVDDTANFLADRDGV